MIPPGTGGMLGPYVALGMGLILVLYTIHRYKAKKPAVAGTVAGARHRAPDGIDPSDAGADRKRNGQVRLMGFFGLKRAGRI